jgi:hypothetical protein
MHPKLVQCQSQLHLTHTIAETVIKLLSQTPQTMPLAKHKVTKGHHSGKGLHVPTVEKKFTIGRNATRLWDIHLVRSSTTWKVHPTISKDSTSQQEISERCDGKWVNDDTQPSPVNSTNPFRKHNLLGVSLESMVHKNLCIDSSYYLL